MPLPDHILTYLEEKAKAPLEERIRLQTTVNMSANAGIISEGTRKFIADILFPYTDE